MALCLGAHGHGFGRLRLVKCYDDFYCRARMSRHSLRERVLRVDLWHVRLLVFPTVISGDLPHRLCICVFLRIPSDIIASARAQGVALPCEVCTYWEQLNFMQLDGFNLLVYWINVVALLATLVTRVFVGQREKFLVEVGCTP